jgi:hypothetical protein
MSLVGSVVCRFRIKRKIHNSLTISGESSSEDVDEEGWMKTTE